MRRCRRASDDDTICDANGSSQPGAIRRIPAGDDQADAAAGAFGEVRGEPVGVAGAILQAGVHRPHHHPVAQSGEPKIQWRQQVWVRMVTGLLQARRHLVEPVDGTLLGADAAAQHQVLVQRAAAERAGVGELALLESAVGVEQLGAFGAQRGDLATQRSDIAVGGGADLDGQIAGAVVGHRTAAPDNGSAIQRANSARPASATVYTFLSGRPCCTTGVTCTQPSSSIVRSVR